MQEEIERNVSCIRDVLSYKRIEIRDIQVVEGPVISLYKIYIVPGVKIYKVKELADDFAMAMGVTSVRTVTLRDSIGVEVPNSNREYIPLKEMMESKEFLESHDELPLIIGHTIDRKVRVIDLQDAPHILVSGATKQGKSMCLNALRASLEAKISASELKIYWLDPKAIDTSKIEIGETLEMLDIEMDDRYGVLYEGHANNIKDYNRRYNEKRLPYIVVFIDEYADLIGSKKIMTSIVRLAQRGRAVGIHLIIATQRPTVDVITGLIKANFPTRIAFRVASRIDSTTILDQPGAEKLIGNGDMLFSSGVEMERLQCAMIEET